MACMLIASYTTKNELPISWSYFNPSPAPYALLISSDLWLRQGPPFANAIMDPLHFTYCSPRLNTSRLMFQDWTLFGLFLCLNFCPFLFLQGIVYFNTTYTSNVSDSFEELLQIYPRENFQYCSFSCLCESTFFLCCVQ